MSKALFPPIGEWQMQSAHGLAVTTNGAGRFTVWKESQRGGWTESKVWRGPHGTGDEAEAAADKLLARTLADMAGHPSVLPLGSSRRRPDEDYLPDDWGPQAAERAVQDGWEREAEARGVTIVNVTAPAPTPEPDTVCCGEGCCDSDAKQAPWGVLPSERQMAAQRDADYGDPGPNFTTTAAYWREHVKAKYGLDVPFDTDDVPAMNVLQKLSRQARKPKRDNWDDISGYADTAVMASSP